MLERLSLWERDGVLAAGEASPLLRWTCLELCQTYNKKNRSPPSHVTTGSLWQFLSRLVEVLSCGGTEDVSALNVHLFQVSM